MIALAITGAAAVPALAQDASNAVSPSSFGEISVQGAEDRAAIRCSAAFALAAGADARGDGLPEYAGLGSRGREYLVLTGARLTAAGWSRAEVAAAMQSAAQDVAGRLPQMAPACRALLNGTVPRMERPTLAQCIATLELSAANPDTVANRNGPALRARAAQLTDELIKQFWRAGAAAGPDAEQAIAEARDEMLTAGNSAAGAYDAEACLDTGLELVKPE